VTASGSALDALRARLADHGYHVFIRPDRPSGWWVTIRSGVDGAIQPIEARAPTRADALALAERLFVSHRLVELDTLVRRAGLTPPLWAGHDQEEHLAQLQQLARSRQLTA
jgi:hypothetical protein